MKVLFVTSTFPRSEDAVFAKWIGEFAVRLKNKGLEVDIFAPAFKGSPSHDYFGIRVHRFRYAPSFLEVLTHDEGAITKIRKNPLFIIIAFFYLFFGSIAITKHLINHKYDVINVHWPFPNGIFGLIAKMIRKTRIVLTFYSAELVLAKHVPFGKIILSHIIKNSEGIIANSDYSRSEIQKIQKHSVSIVRYASAFSAKKNITKKHTKNGKKILFVGRLIERKGVEFLISSMPKVLRGVEVELQIVGDGPLFPSLQKQINSLSLQKNVKLYGKISDRDLKKMYEECDVFVLPSIIDRWGDTEGLGVVLLEAMSFGKPVIASSVGGIIDIVKNERTGLLVSEKDPDSLANAIIKILTDEKLAGKLGETGYKYVMNNFNWDTLV